jgi:hypothetical protein
MIGKNINLRKRNWAKDEHRFSQKINKSNWNAIISTITYKNDRLKNNQLMVKSSTIAIRYD